MADENEADRLGYVKESAEKEGVTIHRIEQWDEQFWIDEERVVVLDVFGLNPVEYRPFVLRHMKQLMKTQKLIIYHSNLQDEEISQQGEHFDALSLQLWPEFPLETLLE